ncbi:response regulator [Paenibacillus wynnii]|uniref:response regulator n=1 Tax=Paenibacillus wynnii TaxID=268407 RepID=UPI002790E3BB|nr:response regulator [Paenibacillus wynnii]MDQ0192505.1 two-component system response regulator YesN [Paenibacillus wynnii]
MLHILLVDDEQYVVDDLELAFPWHEFGAQKVYKAYSGYQAMQMVMQYPIDILITDIAMPGMSGLELVKQVRQDKRRIKCILLTGYAEFEYAQEALQQGVVEYLVKPLDHSKLRVALEDTVKIIRAEIDRTASYEKALLAFREHLPALKDKLLVELIQGKKYSLDRLREKLSGYQLNFQEQDEIYLILIRLEEHFTSFGLESQLLFEYAVTNIACELLGGGFEVWHCRDPYENLVFLVKCKEETLQADTDRILKQLTHNTHQLHHNVNDYLRGGISVILSYAGEFVQDIRSMYEDSLAALRQQIGNDKGYFISLTDKRKSSPVQPLKDLYAPPTLMHLLETGQWEGYKERLQQMKELTYQLPKYTEEYIEEIRSLVLGSFHHIAHMNHRLLSDLVGRELLNKTTFRSLSQLIVWGETLVDTLQARLEKETQTNQQSIVKDMQSFIATNLADANLQSVADCVSLHPVYVSRLFKQISGISISEYILNMKMEQAVTWLRSSDMKIYEISDQLGYANSQYFIRVFKDKFGMTPQEFRGKL